MRQLTNHGGGPDALAAWAERAEEESSCFERSLPDRDSSKRDEAPAAVEAAVAARARFLALSASTPYHHPWKAWNSLCMAITCIDSRSNLTTRIFSEYADRHSCRQRGHEHPQQVRAGEGR